METLLLILDTAVITQGIATAMGFLLLSQLGNPSTLSGRSGHSHDLSLPAGGPGRSDEGAEISLVEDILPVLLSRTGAFTQIVINAMLVR